MTFKRHILDPASTIAVGAFLALCFWWLVSGPIDPADYPTNHYDTALQQDNPVRALLSAPSDLAFSLDR